MTLETYIPDRITYAGQPLATVFAAVLYDPDSDTPHGAITTHDPLPEGERGGPLRIDGTRDGRTWRVTMPQIEVVRSTAVGFEFNIYGRVRREPGSGPRA